MTITLKQGDCLELMKELPDESVDLVVTDPPYYRIMTKEWNGNKHEWDNQWDTFEAYLKWCNSWFIERNNRNRERKEGNDAICKARQDKAVHKAALLCIVCLASGLGRLAWLSGCILGLLLLFLLHLLSTCFHSFLYSANIPALINFHINFNSALSCSMF